MHRNYDCTICANKPKIHNLFCIHFSIGFLRKKIFSNSEKKFRIHISKNRGYNNDNDIIYKMMFI